MKLVKLWDKILKKDSEFVMVVCDNWHTLLKINVNPETEEYHLPFEFRSWDIKEMSIREGQVHVWVE